ncbi:hypothetical protein Bca4012_014575 [Brassica carinata]
MYENKKKTSHARNGGKRGQHGQEVKMSGGQAKSQQGIRAVVILGACSRRGSQSKEKTEEKINMETTINEEETCEAKESSHEKSYGDGEEVTLVRAESDIFNRIVMALIYTPRGPTEGHC